MAIQITVNGNERDIPEGWTVLDLLADLERHPKTVAIEYNGDILPREKYSETGLGGGDRLEVVGFVQGG